MAGLVIVSFYAFLALFGPYIAPYPPRSFQCLYQGCTSLPPFVDWAHPLGTEPSGIDVFSEIIHATRYDLFIGVFATLISLAIALLVGAPAGFRGGVAGSVLLGLSQVFYVFPLLPLLLVASRILVLAVAKGLGIYIITLFLGIFGWPGLAFVIRGEILRVKELEFVQAAKALGAPGRWILLRHLVPNVLPPVVVLSSLAIAGNILTEVIISFLGFGDPNTVTWGLLLQEGFEYIRSAPWVTLFPGLAIMFCVLGFNLLGDGLNDALNPRLKE